MAHQGRYIQRQMPVTGDGGMLSMTTSFVQVLLKDPTEIIAAMSRASEGADRVKASLGFKDFHILKHPDDIQAVFVDHAAQCPVTHAKSSASSYKPGGTKLGNSSGDPAVWKQHRATIGHHVGAKGLRHNYESAVNAALPGIASWADHGPINVNHETTKIALKYAWSAFFTSEIENNDAEDLAAVGTESLQKFFLLTFATLGKVSPKIIRQVSNVGTFTDALDKKLDKVINARLSLQEQDCPGDFLTEVITKNKLDENPFDPVIRNQVQSELTEILVASYLNTRSAFYWQMHNLALRPDLQDRIRRETLTGEKADPQGIWTAEGVAYETLRLYPPVYLLPREAQADITLAGGYNIAAGSHIMIPTWNVHRDPRWYPDPLNFNPDENFSPAAYANRPHQTYLPFGLGRHKCPGYAAAVQELTTLQSIISVAYEIKPDIGGAQPYLRAGTILNPEHESTLVVEPRRGASVHDAAKLFLDAA